MDTIKCGRITYELKAGDTVLDNGSCIQLVSRSVSKGFHSYPPRVSKAAFIRFKGLDRVIKEELKGKCTNWLYT